MSVVEKDLYTGNFISPLKSLEQSLKEMQLMRQGVLPKKTWKELKSELNTYKGK